MKTMSQSVLKQYQERGNVQVRSSGWVIKDKVNKMGLSELKSPTVPFPAFPPWVF